MIFLIRGKDGLTSESTSVVIVEVVLCVIYNVLYLDPTFYFVLPFLCTYIQGGSVIRLFHKELEAYLVAEGLFDEVVTEDGE